MKYLCIVVFALLTVTGCDDNNNDTINSTNNANNTNNTNSTNNTNNVNNTTIVQWESCSLFEGQNDGRAECAFIDAPLFYGDTTNNRSISIGVKRYMAGGESEGQIWLLQGGPAASTIMSLGFSQMADTIRSKRNLDIYFIDQRGTGYSTYLSCPDQESTTSEGGVEITLNEWPECFSHLDTLYGENGIHGFSTTNSAHDIKLAMELTRDGEKPVFIFGVSYGTYLAQRYLKLYPDSVSGIVFDSTIANSVPILNVPYHRNENGRRYMDACMDDDFCSSKLGDNPWRILTELSDDLVNGHCSELGFTKNDMGYIYNWLTWYKDINRAFPALVYRLYRCNEDDVQAIIYMWNNLFGGDGGFLNFKTNERSAVLASNIWFSDLFYSSEFDDVDIPSYLTTMQDEVYAAQSYDATTMLYYENFNKYSDPLVNTMPVSDTPVLIMSGGFDGGCPLESGEPLGHQLNGSNQHYIVHPVAAHGVVAHSPCTWNIFGQFIRDPLADLDTSCIDQESTFDFSSNENISQYVFGTADLWENGPITSCPFTCSATCDGTSYPQNHCPVATTCCQ
jgi:pimeloyl-ACP methyl ester carboxylesterase